MVISVPLAWWLEAWVVSAIMPPAFAELRHLLRPVTTFVTWGLVGLAVPVAVVAIIVHRWLWRRVALSPAGEPERDWQRFSALMVSASVAQAPGLLAVLAAVFGAEGSAVGAAVGVSSLGVAALGFFMDGKSGLAATQERSTR